MNIKIKKIERGDGEAYLSEGLAINIKEPLSQNEIKEIGQSLGQILSELVGKPRK